MQFLRLPRFAILLPALLLLGGGLHAEPIDDLLKKGDACDEKLQAAEALKFYLPAEKLDPKDPRPPTRIARQYRHLMADACSRKRSCVWATSFLAYAQRAAALGPNDSEAAAFPRHLLR